MKIAVASDDQITIAKNFQRTKGFTIADFRDGRVESWKYCEIGLTDHNNDPVTNRSNSDLQRRIITLLKECDVLILNATENNLFNDLESIGIEICFTNEMYVATAISYYISGILCPSPQLRYNYV